MGSEEAGGRGTALVNCPECQGLAEIVDEFDLDSTDGPITHVRLSCFYGHHLVAPKWWLED